MRQELARSARARNISPPHGLTGELLLARLRTPSLRVSIFSDHITNLTGVALSGEFHLRYVTRADIPGLFARAGNG